MTNFIIESFKHFQYSRKESEFKFNITPFSSFSFCFLYPPLRVPFPPLPRDKKYVSQFMIEDEWSTTVEWFVRIRKYSVIPESSLKQQQQQQKQYKSYGHDSHWKTQLVSIYQNLWTGFNISKMIRFFVPWRIKSWKSTYNFKDSVVVSQAKRIRPLYASMHIWSRAENTNYFCGLQVGQAAPMTSLCPPVSFLQFSAKFLCDYFIVMQLFNYDKNCH